MKTSERNTKNSDSASTNANTYHPCNPLAQHRKNSMLAFLRSHSVRTMKEKGNPITVDSVFKAAAVP